jgi:hypothetical protein
MPAQETIGDTQKYRRSKKDKKDKPMEKVKKKQNSLKIKRLPKSTPPILAGPKWCLKEAERLRATMKPTSLQSAVISIGFQNRSFTSPKSMRTGGLTTTELASLPKNSPSISHTSSPTQPFCMSSPTQPFHTTSPASPIWFQNSASLNAPPDSSTIFPDNVTTSNSPVTTTQTPDTSSTLLELPLMSPSNNSLVDTTMPLTPSILLTQNTQDVSDPMGTCQESTSKATVTTKAPAKTLTFFTYRAQLTFGLKPCREVNVANMFLQWFESTKVIPTTFVLTSS